MHGFKTVATGNAKAAKPAKKSFALCTLRSIVVAVIALTWAVPARVDGQATKTPAPAVAKRSIPRLADGHPDLQGTYDLATLTPVERAAGSPLAMSDEQAKRLEQQAAARRDQQGAPIKGDRPAPPVGGDGSPGPAGNVGGYNSFWIDAEIGRAHV